MGIKVSEEYTTYIFMAHFYLENGGNVWNLRFYQQLIRWSQAIIVMEAVYSSKISGTHPPVYMVSKPQQLQHKHTGLFNTVTYALPAQSAL